MKNKKGITSEILIKLLILIIMFAIIGAALLYLLKRYNVI